MVNKSPSFYFYSVIKYLLLLYFFTQMIKAHEIDISFFSQKTAETEGVPLKCPRSLEANKLEIWTRVCPVPPLPAGAKRS